MSEANVLFRGPAEACVFDEGKYGKGGRPCIRLPQIAQSEPLTRHHQTPRRAHVFAEQVLFRGPAGACVFAEQIRQRREVVHPSP